jgi:hypothetical protein
MAIPWLTVLKALPWAAILAKAPDIARAADRAASNARRKTGEAAAVELQGLSDRVAAIEQNQLETAEILKQMADQTQRLTTAIDVLAARLRWLLVLSAIACALAVIGLVLILW